LILPPLSTMLGKNSECLDMAANRAQRNPTPLNDLVGSILDPVLRKRAGISLSLVQSWEEVVGPHAASRSRPERVIWPRGKGAREALGGATLVVACEASAALELQHETSEIIARVNGFLGHQAVGKVKLVQKTVTTEPFRARAKPMPISREESQAIARLTAAIEDEGLRAALQRLGASVRASRREGIKST
jgi:hypothetical protein